MNRDPFFTQIVERLKGKLDPDLFESCVADLLRIAYPTLTPIRGGDDAGMDGAIADAEGEPFPLVTTTGKDVIGNLTRNLKSYLSRDGTRRKVILATSQDLTQRKRENLFARASELGFTLIAIHDQDAMAYLLYRSPEWCRELLNLTGDPSPLSVVPRTTRPYITNALIGRDQDLDWLHVIDGDCLIVGQPGIGKTTLLRTLIDEGKALFVISQDRGEIAAALRQQEDQITLIVDDAHLYKNLIPDLLQLRIETGAKFSILASCWPGFNSRIADILNLSEQEIHQLDLLTRDEMVSVVKSAGLVGSNNLIREIVNQAQGRPGLAVTLAALVLRGGVPDLLSGNALHRMLIKVLEDLDFSPKTRLILASLSFGGNAGMSIKDVAEFLELGRTDVWEIVTRLDESGIVYEMPQGYVSVQPPPLRHVLIRDVFFESNISPFPIEELLASTPNITETALTLLGVKARRGQVPEQFLLQVLGIANSTQAWVEYAWRGKKEAQWVFTNLRQSVISLAGPLLTYIPESIIPELLQRAIGDHRPLNANPNHPLRLLGDWIKTGRPGNGQPFFRRHLLLQVVHDWLLDNNDIDVGFQALQWTTFPGYEFSSSDPGSGNTLTMYFGLLPVDELLSVADLWKEVVAIIGNIEVEQWESIRQMIKYWAYPSLATANRVVPDETYKLMQVRASGMLQDIIPLTSDQPGIMQWAARIVDHLHMEIEIPIDKEYQILYPDRELDDWRVAQERQAAAVRELAKQWSQEDPEKIVNRITFIEKEARKVNAHYPRLTPYLCRQIAQQVELEMPWLQALIMSEATYDLVAPFLNKAAQSGQPYWQEYAIVCLEHQNYKLATIELTLRMQEPPQNLLERVLQELPDCFQTVETMCLLKEIPVATLSHLLQHENSVVAIAAAEGEWHSEPKGEVREQIYEEWRNVVLNQVTEGDWLEQVFQKDPSLAYLWLEIQLKKEDFMLFKREDRFKVAIGTLDSIKRTQLLKLVSENQYLSGDLIANIVRDDLSLFEELLSSEALKDFHLAPLQDYSEETWIQKALVALDNGYSVEKVAKAVHCMPDSWWGNESAMWEDCIQKFEVLCSHEDERIKAVAIIVYDRAKINQTNDLQRERFRDVFGRW